MDTKRKASGPPNGNGNGNGNATDNNANDNVDERSAKRRKLQDYNLSQGETPESTTAYGLACIEQLRRTSDKNGRLVAKCFEKLPPRKGNADYYATVRVPISIKTAEQKLHNGEFNNLSELEGYFKRMIQNAKQVYPKNSEIGDCAERVRKAIGNWMKKSNPAHQRDSRYQAPPWPLPEEEASEKEDAKSDAEENVEVEENKQEIEEEEEEIEEEEENEQEVEGEEKENEQEVEEEENEENEQEVEEEEEEEGEEKVEEDENEQEEGEEKVEEDENEQEAEEDENQADAKDEEERLEDVAEKKSKKGGDNARDEETKGEAEGEDAEEEGVESNGTDKKEKPGEEYEAEDEDGQEEDEVEDGDGAEEEEEDAEREEHAEKEEDAEKEEEPAKEGDEAEEEIDDADEEKREDDDEQQEQDDKKQNKQTTSTPVVIKRRGPGRPPKNPLLHAQKMALKAAADSQYIQVPYSACTFQQAQEKIVEELLRKKDEDGYDYYEPFFNLPPRTLKDYYQVIAEPLSLRYLQKLAKGIQVSRGRIATGTTEFKGWAAFEEKASLLWGNAYYYNEDSSEIYSLAKELEQNFKQELAKAKAVVDEPPQPKIKLKVGAASAATATSQLSTSSESSGMGGGGSKKITIHVGGRNGEIGPFAAATSTPIAVRSSSRNGTSRNGTSRTGTPRQGTPRTGTPRPLMPPAQTNGLNATYMSRSPSVQELRGPSPAVYINHASPVPVHPVAQATFVKPVQPAPAPTQTATAGRLYDMNGRRPGKSDADASISWVRLQSHEHIRTETPMSFDLYAHPYLMSQNVTVYLPQNVHRFQLLVKLNPSLIDVQFGLHVRQNHQLIYPLLQRAPPHPASPYGNAPAPAPDLLRPFFFDLAPHMGPNVIDVHLVSAIRAEERQVGGYEAELETMTLNLIMPAP